MIHLFFVSPVVYPIIFVKKNNNKWKLCINYQKFNHITIKN